MNLVEFGVATGAVIGLVYWIKSTWNLEGKSVNIVSMILGIFFGGLYQLVQIARGNPMPTEWVGWLTVFLNVVVAGIIMGLTASGLYNTDKEIMTKAIIKSIQVNAGDVPTSVSHTPPEILEQINRAMKS